LQLQSVYETSNFIQASLQIPGEKLALNSDLHFDIEGEKTENGMVNPNHCRILFYLDLKNLKETIIDMHIQKRTVAVTIFNDEEHLQVDSQFLQPMLKEGLSTLDYHLTTVTIKPLQQVDKHIKKRTVAVTIFNDDEHLQVDSQFLQPMLKEGLSTLDYHLTTITIKPLQQVDKPAKKQMPTINQQSYQGVDYRI